MKWSGRSLSLLDPTYAKKFIPIIASVSEHQPTTWGSFFFDSHMLMVLGPLGLYQCLTKNNEARLFIALFGVLSIYFASVMVRLLLVLCPALCVLAGIGLSDLLYTFTRHIKNYQAWFEYYRTPEDKRKPEDKPKYGYPLDVAMLAVVLVGAISMLYYYHCTWVAAEAYSSPTIIMASKTQSGQKRIIDDYREAYYWLRMNTDQDARIMSWWDYGYQITGMSNRTVLVDNNTWNNTHIATMGMIFASNEDEAATMLRNLDVNYVLVTFGGLSYYSGDDINKFLWMIRIASGVFPHIKEDDFLNRGSYRIDTGATVTMKESLMFKLCYYRFSEVSTSYSKPPGYDVVRNTEVGVKNIKLKHFREVYTTQHWMIRIFELLPEENRETMRPRALYSPKGSELLRSYNLTYEKTQPKIVSV
jgi:dolichyl-diphosphooligosaccharide--protein glycosyltransferase